METGQYQDFDVIPRSSLSLDRNLAGRPFPANQSVAAASEAGSLLAAAARSCVLEVAKVGDLDPWARANLAERELYARPYLLDDERYAALSPVSPLWASFNEPNHLSIRASRPGLNLLGAWDDVAGLDDALSDALGGDAWAFDPDFGFILSDMSFCGSGLAARVTLHVPALVVAGLAETAFKRAMEAGFVVSGAYSSLGAAGGSLFDVSLPRAYRDPEPTALGRLESAAKALADYERRARRQLLSGGSWELLDYIGRAAGKALGARLVNRDEAAEIASGLRLGAATGVLEGLGMEAATELWPALRMRPLRRDGADVADSEPDAAWRARALRRASSGIHFSQRYSDV